MQTGPYFYKLTLRGISIMFVPFISKARAAPVADKTASGNNSGFAVLTEKEYQAVASGPQIQNDPTPG
jgi:hypothetical protein